MKVLAALGLLFVLYGFGATAHATDAVLLKPYPVLIIRGNYVLGRRTVHTGEIVKVFGIEGDRAEVATGDGDAFVVLAADMRILPEPLAAAHRALFQPLPQPSAAPILADETPTNDPPHAARKERRAVAVRCGHLTRKGTQCSRMTNSPNGFCWQHGGD